MSGPGANRRLRVMTMTDGIVGGAEALAALIAERLDPERFESIVCATRWETYPEADVARARLAASPAEYISLHRRSRLDVRPWPGLIREMRRRRIDILHTHKIGSNIWGALIAPRVPVPVFIAHEHSWSWEGQPQRKLLDRLLVARRADAFVAVSGLDQRRMTEIEKIPPEKTRYIPMGIPTPEGSGHAPAAIRSELGAGTDDPVVGMVAALRSQKNFELLIEAAGMVRDEFPNVRFWIVGGEESPEDDERGRLQRHADDLGLADTVNVVGPRQDVFDVITALDIGALSSDYEGSPRSVLEYMEAAKPVVATRVGGVPDMIVDGETGFLVELRNAAALAEGISKLLRDPARAAEMGRAGQERRRREFTIEAMVARVEDLYEELFAASGAE